MFTVDVKHQYNNNNINDLLHGTHIHQVFTEKKPISAQEGEADRYKGDRSPSRNRQEKIHEFYELSTVQECTIKQNRHQQERERER